MATFGLTFNAPRRKARPGWRRDNTTKQEITYDQFCDALDFVGSRVERNYGGGDDTHILPPLLALGGQGLVDLFTGIFS